VTANRQPKMYGRPVCRARRPPLTCVGQVVSLRCAAWLRGGLATTGQPHSHRRRAPRCRACGAKRVRSAPHRVPKNHAEAALEQAVRVTTVVQPATGDLATHQALARPPWPQRDFSGARRPRSRHECGTARKQRRLFVAVVLVHARQPTRASNDALHVLLHERGENRHKKTLETIVTEEAPLPISPRPVARRPR
jgi:hypothetical protein